MGDKKKIFIASSSDLASMEGHHGEREKLYALLQSQDFEAKIWEDFDHSIKENEFQEYINEEHLKQSDVVIFMIKSRLGEYTLEEFKVAYSELGKTIERMYVYFFDIKATKENRDEINKIWELQEFLEKEKKFYIEVEDYKALENHFLKQLKHINSKEEKINICNSNNIQKHIKILLMISVFILKVKGNSQNSCIKYKKLRKKLLDDYSKKDIDASLVFLIMEDYIEKEISEEIEYIKLLSKANKKILDESKLLKKVKKSLCTC